MSAPHRVRSTEPETVAQGFVAYCEELSNPTWRSRGLRCPKCESKRFVKCGMSRWGQRFLCNKCGRNFTETTGHHTEPEKPIAGNTLSSIRTTVLRVLVSGWGGPVVTKPRMNEADQTAALNFLGGLDLGRLLQAEAALAQGFITLGIPNPNQKTYRYQLRQMVDWLREQGWLPLGDVMPPKTLGGQPIGTFKDRYKHRPEGRTRQAKPDTVHIKKDKYALQESERSAALCEEIKAYRQFCRRLRPETINTRISELMRFLGWQHWFEGVPLEDLTLAKLIPFVPVKPHHRNIVTKGCAQDFSFVEELVCQQEALDQQAMAVAQQLEARLERYFEFQSGCVVTQHNIAKTMVYLAKFVYREEIDRLGLERQITLKIPVIKRLRDMQASRAKLVRSTAPVNSYEGRSVPWRQVFDVLKQQQRKADEPYSYFTRVVNGKEYLGRNKRRKTAIARDVQTFLILLFFIAVPPDRIQGIQALELGKTLIQGCFESGEFIPIERLAEPEAAKWYVQLKADQYKTGKSYGNYWGEVPNVPLGQGKFFYDYLELWIYQHRPAFEPDHDFLFVKTQNRLKKARAGEPMTKAGMKGFFKGAFSAYANASVPPQVMRSMFATYLNQVGASEAELEAAAAAMRHSRSTQRKHYDRQDKFSKIQPVIEMNRQLFDSVGDSSSAVEALPLTEGPWVDYRRLSDQQLQNLLQQLKRLPKQQA